MKTGGRLLYVSSVYMDGKVLEITKNLPELTIMSGTSSANIIISADSNAHSTLWWCESNNVRGNMRDDFIATHHLQLLNQGNMKTFRNPLGSSIIDITLTNDALVGSILGWRVDKSH